MFLIFSYKKFFLHFGKVIFSTMSYLELEAYSEHCQASMMERFAELDTWCTFRPQSSKFFPKITCYRIVIYTYIIFI